MTDAARFLPTCEQVMHELFYCLDETRYERLAALFEDNGIWHRQGEVLSGREQILSALAKRPVTQRIRHVITNTFVESTSGGVAQVVAYMTAYRFDNGLPQQGAVAISRPFRLSVIRAELSTDTGRIVEMRMETQFDFVADAAAGSAQ